MSIQTKLYILGAIFVVMLVIIHPVGKSAAQKEADRKKAMITDPLVTKIEEYNKKNTSPYSSALKLFDNNPYNANGGAAVNGTPNGANGTNYPSYQRQNGSSPYTPPGQNPNQPSFTNQYYGIEASQPPAAGQIPAYNQPVYNQQNPAAQTAPATPQPQQGYYPPPPQSQGSSSTSGGRTENVPMNTNQFDAPPLSLRNMLSDGRRLAYNGPYVYLMQDGQQVPLPDGDYQVSSGVSMHVRAGQKMVISNN